MESTNVKLYSLNYGNVRTYLAASLFIVGNILFPQFFHLIPQGGITWLPIYFFTLIGAYKYGWKVGLLTAVLSPIINSSLFGMPMPVVLPAILLKSVLLAIAAGWAAQRFGRISIPVLVGVVLTYQVVGTLGEWMYIGNFYKTVQDFRIGIHFLFDHLVASGRQGAQNGAGKPLVLLDAEERGGLVRGRHHNQVSRSHGEKSGRHLCYGLLVVIDDLP